MKPIRTLALLALALPAMAATPPAAVVVHHEGRLLDGQDNPVSGALSLTFGIFDGPDQDSASELWSATYPVTVSGGIYAVDLGDTSTGQPPLAASLFTAPRWLSVTIGGTELLPRMRIGATPLALDSDSLGGLPASDYALQKGVDALSDSLVADVSSLQAAIQASHDDAVSEAESYALAQDRQSSAALSAAIQAAQGDAISEAEANAAMLYMPASQVTGGIAAAVTTVEQYASNASHLTSGTMPLGRIPQGPGSGLDADTVDGKHASDLSLLSLLNGAITYTTATYDGATFSSDLIGGVKHCSTGYHVCNGWEWSIIQILGQDLEPQAPGSGAWITGGFNNWDGHLRSLTNGQDWETCPAGEHLTGYPRCCGNEPGWGGYFGRLHCQSDSNNYPIACCRNNLIGGL